MRLTIPLPPGVTGTPTIDAFVRAGSPVLSRMHREPLVGRLVNVRAEPGYVTGDFEPTQEMRAEIDAMTERVRGATFEDGRPVVPAWGTMDSMFALQASAGVRLTDEGPVLVEVAMWFEAAAPAAPPA